MKERLSLLQGDLSDREVRSSPRTAAIILVAVFVKSAAGSPSDMFMSGMIIGFKDFLTHICLKF